MSRRIIVRTAAALLAVALTAGCVKQPFDESLLAPTEGLGATAAPLEGATVDRVAGKAQRRKARRKAAAVDAAGDTTAAAAGEATGASSGGSSADPATSPRRSGRTQQGDVSGGGERAPLPSAPGFSTVLDAPDPAGDATGEAPAYADAERFVIESDGRTARVSVAVGGAVPGALADGEVEGIGVDFFRSERRESDYQLFAAGNAQGWQAFLHTPDGIVAYPGAFRIGGRVVQFEVPWSALGGTRPARASLFIDWSQERTLLNDIGNDRAPNDGRYTVRPAR